MEEAGVRSPSEESGLFMQPLRDRTASFGILNYCCSIYHWLSVVVPIESGHEDNEDEGEDGNPAMSAGKINNNYGECRAFLASGSEHTIVHEQS